MGALEVLQHPHAACSSAWRAVLKLLGATALAYEPDTLRIELERRGIEWTPSLAAKVLGAQTIQISREWVHNYDVFFAFALAASGVPAASDALHHPSPVDLAWAVMDIEELTGAKLTDDEGFDPDRVDPAIAVVLHDDGWVYTPDSLRFAQDALDLLNHDPGHTLRDEVAKKWAAVKGLDAETVKRAYGEIPDNAVKVQLGHLYDCATELNARGMLREHHRHELA